MCRWCVDIVLSDLVYPPAAGKTFPIVTGQSIKHEAEIHGGVECFVAIWPKMAFQLREINAHHRQKNGGRSDLLVSASHTSCGKPLCFWYQRQAQSTS